MKQIDPILAAVLINIHKPIAAKTWPKMRFVEVRHDPDFGGRIATRYTDDEGNEGLIVEMWPRDGETARMAVFKPGPAKRGFRDRNVLRTLH